jgi:hypothetical protein
MKIKSLLVSLLCNCVLVSYSALTMAEALIENSAVVSIHGNKFYINNQVTYKNINWLGNNIEGLLFNSRMVQGIFDDENPTTRDLFAYPDTHQWDANRNTDEFIAAMPSWKAHGLLAVTINLQGGSPTGYGNKAWINSAFQKDGQLKKSYLARLARILDAAKDLNMVVILGYFYFGQDEVLENEQAVIAATDNITRWLLNQKYHHVLVEINNEADIAYDHEILKPNRVHELILRVKEKSNHKFLVSTSFSGGTIPTDKVIAASDFILLHANGVESADGISNMIKQVKSAAGYSEKPIVFNEDDHFNFDSPTSNFSVAIRHYASWGYFDYRMNGEPFEFGFQSVPVDWSINSPRKRDFFNFLRSVTSGAKQAVDQKVRLQQYIGLWYATDKPDDLVIGKNPQIKMQVTRVMDGSALQVIVFEKNRNTWKQMLVELIGYDSISDKIVALGQGVKSESFWGWGYFDENNIWYMKDVNAKGDYTLNVKFKFLDKKTVFLEGIAPSLSNNWKVKYIKID